MFRFDASPHQIILFTQSFKAKLRKLSDALEMQQKLFDEQQGLQQALLNEQLAAKKLEGEAEAMKLKGKVVEAEARLKEMEGRLAAAHKELEDNKLSHQKEVRFWEFRQQSNIITTPLYLF